MANKKLNGLENFFYYAFVLLTFGGLWLYKVACKKAMIEMEKQNKK